MMGETIDTNLARQGALGSRIFNAVMRARRQPSFRNWGDSAHALQVIMMSIQSTACALALVTSHIALAELPSDFNGLAKNARLPVPARPHWVWINDFVFPHMVDGMAYLVDGDSGRYLGTLSTGYSFAGIVLPRSNSLIYSPETYFSRGTRGKRTDVVTIYDEATLSPVGEIPIPPKRSSNVPMMANSALTDDDRFLLIYNFTPAQSLTLVDMKSRRFLREIATPGCALVYATGPRSAFSVCGDGSVLLYQLADSGAVTTRQGAQNLPMKEDPVSEKAVRLDDTWYFPTFDGMIYPVQADGKRDSISAAWPLSTAEERKLGWRPGGLQEIAVSVPQKRLYALMHRGDRSTHKDPGTEVWVFDLASHRHIQTFALKRPATSIQLTRDGALLFSISIEASFLDVYDPASGHVLRSVDQLGTTPCLLMTP